jgi:hypothetical protein
LINDGNQTNVFFVNALFHRGLFGHCHHELWLDEAHHFLLGATANRPELIANTQRRRPPDFVEFPAFSAHAIHAQSFRDATAAPSDCHRRDGNLLAQKHRFRGGLSCFSFWVFYDF